MSEREPGGDLDGWDAFEKVYRESYRPVQRFLMRRMRPEAAEDAAAEVFTIAWRRWSDRRGEALPWLYGIARKVAANHRRADGRAEQLILRVEEAVDRSAPARHASAEEAVLDRVDALAALNSLSESDREALLLVSWDGLDAADAARVMGRGRAAFAVQLHRARKKVERALSSNEVAVPVRKQSMVAREMSR
ncbi:sigma-70 family RNA polymerase sigma factor [Streptomyces hirsutus]|uniref:Sigma-70 family RNA polymerase sigma factor n=1 Tax=Streptomyces hirsutus TaxID=35620 RepID=A0ABZ1GRY3_9ACTN|nr:sigma-70 family RNA polymerase sigma factor [Streptomyces hirsutus]WSD07879.1 sigma-70 family RNA polymerase sigma factor [Streptomyces hirsutus]